MGIIKQPYNWDYTIKIKTKEGTFEYEKNDLCDLDLLLMKHPNYEEVRAEHKEDKPKALTKRNNNVRPRNKNKI